MADVDAMASAMFPNHNATAPATPDRLPATPTSENTMADRLFGSTTKPTTPSAPNLYDKRGFNSLDEQDRGARLFGDADPALNHGDGMRAIESAAMEQFLSTPEEAREAAEHWGAEFQSFGLNSSESAAVAEIGVAAFTTPPTPELVATWTEQAREVLVADYGPQGAAQALADARTFVTTYASPELRDVLMSTGLGSNPQIVRLAVAKARALKMAGKL